MNLLGLGISGDKPRLSRISPITVSARFSGTLSQWSNVDCQNACPEVADLISADKPKVSATGIYPLIMVMGPFCSEESILPRFRMIMPVTSPTHCAGTETPILYMGSRSTDFAVRNEPKNALRMAGMICAGPRCTGSSCSWLFAEGAVFACPSETSNDHFFCFSKILNAFCEVD